GDAVPHSQYHFESFMKECPEKKKGLSPALLRDFLFLGFDISLGMLVPLYLFWKGDARSLLVIALGAFGGMFPDALQFFHWLLPKGLFKLHQDFHDCIHTKNKLPGHSFYAALSQAAIAALCVLISRLKRPRK